jgi:hypothetical protein
MKRPLDKIIDIILVLVPDNFEGKQYLQMELGSIKESYKYAAPETYKIPWARTSQALQTHIGAPDGETWKREIQGIFSGNIDYTDYLIDLRNQ